MSSIRQNAIADKLKLSVATVSRSLANHPSISIETRARVLQMAEELGYKKSVARNSRPTKADRKPITIGVLIGLHPNSSPQATFPLILKGINERAALDRVSVEVNYVDPNEFDPEAWGNTVVRQVRKGTWRGIILVYPYSPKVVEALARKTTIVSTMEDYDNLGIDSIDTSHQAGIVRMVERLVSLGHRRIGFVTWAYPFTGHWSAQRFAAYVNGVFTMGIEFRQDWVFNVHKAARTYNPAEIAGEVARKIREDGVTAWMCAADHQAYPLIADLRARGIRVPEDCSVTGFDGIDPPPTLKPVTSLKVPSEAIGFAAIARLINRIKHPKVPKRKILVETEYIEGTTIAPAPEGSGSRVPH
jgi:LacI family transcriptional regulator